MSLDFSGLSDMAKAPVDKPGWAPLTVNDLGLGTVLCFDQSLTATGCVLLTRTYPGSYPIVVWAEQWPNLFEGKDVATSLKRGRNVFVQSRVAIRKAMTSSIDAIVHESPPNPAAVKGSGTSSLMAAQALWCAVEDMDPAGVDFEMVGSQPAKKLICGKANADKKTAHAALKDTVLPWIVNSQKITNEATRDALMVGLLWLHRRKT